MSTGSMGSTEGDSSYSSLALGSGTESGCNCYGSSSPNSSSTRSELEVGLEDPSFMAAA